MIILILLVTNAYQNLDKNREWILYLSAFAEEFLSVNLNVRVIILIFFSHELIKLIIISSLFDFIIIYIILKKIKK